MEALPASLTAIIQTQSGAVEIMDPRMVEESFVAGRDVMIPDLRGMIAARETTPAFHCLWRRFFEAHVGSWLPLWREAIAKRSSRRVANGTLTGSR